jgi:hypothetical protein
METQTMVERLLVLSFVKKNSIIDKILAVRLEGLFWAKNKMGFPLGSDFGLGLWRLHTMAVQVERPWDSWQTFGLWIRPWRLHIVPGRRLRSLYFTGWLFSAHFFGLSTKLGHSVPWPLDFDGHSMK